MGGAPNDQLWGAFRSYPGHLNEREVSGEALGRLTDFGREADV